jgi:hypothetical protein
MDSGIPFFPKESVAEFSSEELNLHDINSATSLLTIAADRRVLESSILQSNIEIGYYLSEGNGSRQTY